MLVSIGALDPVATLSNQLSDLIEITEAFKATPELRALDYLRAVNTVRENLQALVQGTVQAITNEVIASDRISSTDIETFHTELMERNWSPEETMHNALSRVAMVHGVDLGDLMKSDDDDDEGEADV